MSIPENPEPKNLKELFKYLQEQYPQYEMREDDIEFLPEQSKSGTFGEVSFGRVKINGTAVAVKRMKQIGDRDATSVFRETMAMIKLRECPFCVSLIGYIINDSFSIVMNHLQGGSLEEKYKELSSTELTIILLGIAYGIKAIHETLNKAHNDIKPDNIILDSQFYPEISDFGSLKNVDTENTSLSTTFAYCAPELAGSLEQKIHSLKGDIYSLGVIANQLHSKKQPYKGLNNFQIIMNKSVGINPDIENDTPDGLKELIEKCFSPVESRPSIYDIIDLIRNHRVGYKGTDWSTVDSFCETEIDGIITKKCPNDREPRNDKDFYLYLQEHFQNFEMKESDIEYADVPKKYGGFGNVKFGNLKSNGAQVAVKRVTDINKDARGIFREVQAMALFKGNRLCMNLVGYFIHNKKFSIVMPWYKGGSLEDRYKKLSPTQATIIAAGVAYGIVSIHTTLNCAHNDLKPDNILLDKKMWPVIADFGSLKNLFTMSRQQTCTFKYVAPEVTSDSDGIIKNLAVDMYSYGIILNQMSTKEEPYEDYPAIKVLNCKLRGITPDMNKSESESLNELIKKCLDKDPRKRPKPKEVLQLFATHKVGFKGTNWDEVDSYLIKNIPKSELPDLLASGGDLLTNSILFDFESNEVILKYTNKKIKKAARKASLIDAYCFIMIAERILYDTKIGNTDPSEEQKKVIYSVVAQIFSHYLEKNVYLIKKSNISLFLSFDRKDNSIAGYAIKIMQISAQINPSLYAEYAKTYKAQVNKIIKALPQSAITIMSHVLKEISKEPNSYDKTKMNIIINHFFTSLPKFDNSFYDVILRIMGLLLKGDFEIKTTIEENITKFLKNNVFITSAPHPVLHAGTLFVMNFPLIKAPMPVLERMLRKKQLRATAIDYLLKSEDDLNAFLSDSSKAPALLEAANAAVKSHTPAILVLLEAASQPDYADLMLSSAFFVNLQNPEFVSPTRAALLALRIIMKHAELAPKVLQASGVPNILANSLRAAITDSDDQEKVEVAKGIISALRKCKSASADAAKELGNVGFFSTAVEFIHKAKEDPQSIVIFIHTLPIIHIDMISTFTDIAKLLAFQQKRENTLEIINGFIDKVQVSPNPIEIMENVKRALTESNLYDTLMLIASRDKNLTAAEIIKKIN